MSDLEAAPSNGASEENAVVETNTQQTSSVDDVLGLPPAKSSGEALDRAFDQIEERLDAKSVQNRSKDGKYAKGSREVKQTEPTEPAQAAAPQFDVAKLSSYGLTKDALAVAASADPKFLADIDRRFTELTQGIEKHRPASESWAKGQKYVEMAKAAGRDVWDVMDQYVNMENALRSPQTRAHGFMALAQNIGVDPMTLANEIAMATQGAQYQPSQPQQRYLTPEEARALARQESEAFYAERNAVDQIQKFKAEHPRFDELEEDIAGMLAHPRIAALPMDQKLQAAYEAAERLNPAAPGAATPAVPQTAAATTTTPAVQPAEKPKAEKPKANLSITGSPDGGSNPATRKIPGSSGDALDAAFARVGL